jgi:hypothetical protein
VQAANVLYILLLLGTPAIANRGLINEMILLIIFKSFSFLCRYFGFEKNRSIILFFMFEKKNKYFSP